MSKLWVYMIDLSLALIGVSLVLHIRNCERKDLASAKFDEHHLCARHDPECHGTSGLDVVRPNADVAHVNPATFCVTNLHHGNGSAANVRDDDATARLGNAEFVFDASVGDDKPNSRSTHAGTNNVPDNGVCEVDDGNSRAYNGAPKQNVRIFHADDYSKTTEDNQ